jgi:Lsr2
LTTLPSRSEDNVQLTIDSKQPLDDVLRVVGAMYDVELSTKPAATATRAGKRAGATRRGSAARVSARRKTAARGASSAEIRRWAIDNGYELGRKGPLPGEVVAAFRAGHR